MAQKFKVVMCSMGGTRQDMYTGLTEQEAIDICEEYGWEVSPDGGYVWDLDYIEDEDYMDDEEYAEMIEREEDD